MESLGFLLEACLLRFHILFNDWGIAIIALSLGQRLLLFPLQIFHFFQQKNLRQIQPEIDRLQVKFKTDPLRAFKEINAVKKHAGIKTGATLVLSVIQIPIFLSIYRVVSATQPLMADPFFWISSLATPDPLLILPLLVALTTYLQLRNSSSAAPQKNSEFAWMFKLVPAVSFAFMTTMPAALVLYYATSGLFQLLVEAALKRGAV